MKDARKDLGSKTTIWEDGPQGRACIAELPGLPCGVPKMHETVQVPNFGEAVCWGVTRPNPTEVKLVLRRVRS
jgi:hypothetical protein